MYPGGAKKKPSQPTPKKPANNITPPQLKQPMEPVLIPILPQKSGNTSATKSLNTTITTAVVGSGAVGRTPTVIKSPQAIPMLERTASQPQTKKSPLRTIGGQVKILRLMTYFSHIILFWKKIFKPLYR